MKLLKVLLPLAVFILDSCLDENKKELKPNSSIGDGNVKKLLQLEDFKTVDGVNDISKVPFEIYSQLDSVAFYTEPSKSSPFIKIYNHKLNNYYGFKETDDFYEIHFSINNNLSKSIKAYVLKEEFQNPSQLMLNGINLYEIRSSNIAGVDDFDTKSFRKFGKIEEISEADFQENLPLKWDEDIVKNPSIQLSNNYWTLVSPTAKKKLIIHQEENPEEGIIKNEYIGYSKAFDAEVFKESIELSSEIYFRLYDFNKGITKKLCVGFPHLLAKNHTITAINNNSDVGVDFVIDAYDSKTSKTKSLLYFNFTNFKVVDFGENGFWSDDHTFFVQVQPINFKESKEGKSKKSFLKITFNKGLF